MQHDLFVLDPLLQASQVAAFLLDPVVHATLTTVTPVEETSKATVRKTLRNLYILHLHKRFISE